MGRAAAQTLALLAALAFGVLAAPPHSGDNAHVVSLEDVTGTGVAARPPLALSGLTGVSEVGYPDVNASPPRRHPSDVGGGGGVVSLEDVTGLSPGQNEAVNPGGPSAYVRPAPAYFPGVVPAFPPRPRHPGQLGGDLPYYSQQRVRDDGNSDVLHVLHQVDYPRHPPPLPPHPRPLHPEQGYDPRHPYSPCYAPGSAAAAAAYTLPSAHAVYALNGNDGKPALLSRSRRSPGGAVPLEDVVGPAAAHYPAYGPPAYVRPNAYNYYSRPNYYARPYNYNGYYNYNFVPVPVACIGLFCL